MTSPIKRHKPLRLHELQWPRPITWYAMVRPGTMGPMKGFPPYRYGPVKARGRLEAAERRIDVLNERGDAKPASPALGLDRDDE